MEFHKRPRQEGAQFITQLLNPTPIHEGLSDVALHEAEHAVAALETGTGVGELSIVPDIEQGSGGHVLMDAFNPVAAAAPDAHGRGGTGHDLMQIKNAGYNVNAMRARAREVLSNKKHVVHALASAAERSGILSRSTINDIHHRARNPVFKITNKLTGESRITHEPVK